MSEIEEPVYPSKQRVHGYEFTDYISGLIFSSRFSDVIIHCKNNQRMSYEKLQEMVKIINSCFKITECYNHLKKLVCSCMWKNISFMLLIGTCHNVIR